MCPQTSFQLKIISTLLPSAPPFLVNPALVVGASLMRSSTRVPIFLLWLAMARLPTFPPLFLLLFLFLLLLFLIPPQVKEKKSYQKPMGFKKSCQKPMGFKKSYNILDEMCLQKKQSTQNLKTSTYLGLTMWRILSDIWGSATPDGTIITSLGPICFLTQSDRGFARGKTFSGKEVGGSGDIILLSLFLPSFWTAKLRTHFFAIILGNFFCN